MQTTTVLLTSEKHFWQKNSRQVVQNRAGGEHALSRVAHTAHLPIQSWSQFWSSRTLIIRYKLTLGVCEQNVFNIYFKVLNQIYLIALGHSLWGIMPKPMQQKYNKFPLRRVQFSEVTCEKISFKDFLSNLCYASKQKLLTTQSCSSSF